MYNPVVTSRTPQWNLQQNHLGMLADHLDMAIVPEICQWSELLTEEAVFFAVQQGIVTPSPDPCFYSIRNWQIMIYRGLLWTPTARPTAGIARTMFQSLGRIQSVPCLLLSLLGCASQLSQLPSGQSPGRLQAPGLFFWGTYCARTRLEYIWIDAYPFLSRFSGTVSHPKLDPETW